MAVPAEFDYARPYDLMVGLWNGMATSYDAQGRYLISVPSLVANSRSRASLASPPPRLTTM